MVCQLSLPRWFEQTARDGERHAMQVAKLKLGGEGNIGAAVRIETYKAAAFYAHSLGWRKNDTFNHTKFKRWFMAGFENSGFENAEAGNFVHPKHHDTVEQYAIFTGDLFSKLVKSTYMDMKE